MLEFCRLCLGKLGQCHLLFFNSESSGSVQRVKTRWGDRTEVILIRFVREYLKQRIIHLVLFAVRELKGEEEDQDVRRRGDYSFVRRTSLTFGASSSSAKKYTPWADIASWTNFAAAAPFADLDMSTNGSSFAARWDPSSMVGLF